MTGLLLAVETVVLALLTLLVIGLLRSHAEILRRLHDLGVDLDDPGPRAVTRDQFNVFPEVPSPGPGDALPAGRDLSGVDLTDGAVSVRVVGVPHATLIAFLSGTCLTCERFWDAFARPVELGLAPGVRLVIVTKSPGEESPAAHRRRRAGGHPARHVVRGVVRPTGYPGRRTSCWSTDRRARRAVRARHRLAPGAGPPRAGGRRRRVRQPARGAAGREAGRRRRPGAAGRRRAHVGRDPARRSQPLPYAHTQW